MENGNGNSIGNGNGNAKQYWQSWHYIALWIIALISLVLNILLFAGLFALRATAQQEVRQVAGVLDQISIQESIEVPIVIDQTLPLSLTVPFSDTFEVPIDALVPVDTTIPFSETIDVPIREVIHIDTTVNVPFGSASIPIPIQTDIPIDLDVTVPIDKQVPVVMEIPVNLLVDVPIQSDVPINTIVPVKMDFPVTVPLEELGFLSIMTQVREAVNRLAQALGVDLDQP
jgi:hypothetical protein